MDTGGVPKVTNTGGSTKRTTLGSIDHDFANFDDAKAAAARMREKDETGGGDFAVDLSSSDPWRLPKKTDAKSGPCGRKSKRCSQAMDKKSGLAAPMI